MPVFLTCSWSILFASCDFNGTLSMVKAGMGNLVVATWHFALNRTASTAGYHRTLQIQATTALYMNTTSAAARAHANGETCNCADIQLWIHATVVPYHVPVMTWDSFNGSTPQHMRSPNHIPSLVIGHLCTSWWSVRPRQSARLPSALVC